jgi:hypothetical protein
MTAQRNMDHTKAILEELDRILAGKEEDYTRLKNLLEEVNETD